MPVRKTRAKRARRVPRQRGDGFFGDIWDGLKKVHNWVKDNKIVSKVAGAFNPAAGAAAAQLGYGRKRRVARRRRA